MAAQLSSAICFLGLLPFLRFFSTLKIVSNSLERKNRTNGRKLHLLMSFWVSGVTMPSPLRWLSFSPAALIFLLWSEMSATVWEPTKKRFNNILTLNFLNNLIYIYIYNIIANLLIEFRLFCLLNKIFTLI